MRVAPLAAVTAAGAIGVACVFAYVLPDLTIPSEQLFGDFRVTIWEPGQDLLHGRDPIRELGSEENGRNYPPLAIALTLPVSALPYEAAVVVWLIALLVGVVGALVLCGVRDWRCFGLALASPPVIAGLAYGNVSLLVVLAIAGVWVMRDRPWRAGLLLGLVIATRIFPWPLLVWLLLTRRLQAAAVAAASSIVLSGLGWAVVSFERMSEFPAVTRSNASEFVGEGVSVAAIVANLGASPGAIGAALLLAGALTLGVAARRRGQDLECFSWTIAAALLASPIVWGHYFALMLVPLALASPYLSRAWLLPYITAPQLTGALEAGPKILDAATGVAFTLLAARQTHEHVRAHATRRRPAPSPQKRAPGHSLQSTNGRCAAQPYAVTIRRVRPSGLGSEIEGSGRSPSEADEAPLRALTFDREYVDPVATLAESRLGDHRPEALDVFLLEAPGERSDPSVYGHGKFDVGIELPRSTTPEILAGTTSAVVRVSVSSDSYLCERGRPESWTT